MKEFQWAAQLVQTVMTPVADPAHLREALQRSIASRHHGGGSDKENSLLKLHMFCGDIKV